MIRINLLPVKAARKKEWVRAQLVILLFTIIVVIAGCAAAYAALLSEINAQKEAITQKEEEINRLKKAIGEVAQYKKLQEELRGKLDILERLKSDRKGPVRLLDDLSGATPGKLWLTSFKESGGNISIGGVGLNEETVAEFLRTLEASPYYGNIELKVIEQINQGGQRLHKFEMSCQVENPAVKGK